MTESKNSPAVEFASTPIVAVDETTIDRVRQMALASPQKRARLCLHPDLNEPLHNMLIVLLRGTDVPMHRHANKAECYHILSGLLTLIIGDGTGRDHQRIPLGPLGSGRQCVCRISAGLWHRVEVETDEVVMHESTVGPFDITGTETLTATGTVSASRPRHALIVGGSRGIGRVLAERWAARGKTVSVLSRSKPQSEDLSPNLAHFSADLRSSTEITAALEQLRQARGCPDEVVFFQRWRGDGETWDAELATTLTGTNAVLTSLAAHWDTARTPSVVMVGSLAARQIAPEQGPAYHVAKAGLEQLMRYYAALWGPRGVRVNAVVPGIVLKESSRSYYEQHPQLQADYERIIPLGRMGRPEEVCAAIEFLCSDQAAYVTGHALIVDGGLSLPMAHAVAVSPPNTASPS